MIKLGITGGIGAGKSLVSRIFRHFDIPVYDADSAAKRLMTRDPELVKAICEKFGNNSYLEDQSLNREYLSKQVFHDPKQLDELNALVHPRVKADTRVWMEKMSGRYSILLKEAALIFETGLENEFDYIITVDAPKELRIQRILDRDHSKREEVEKRMVRQWDPKLKKTKSDFVINNDGNTLLIPQVYTILEKVKQHEIK